LNFNGIVVVLGCSIEVIVVVVGVVGFVDIVADVADEMV
jgi:hypothetical protein